MVGPEAHIRTIPEETCTNYLNNTPLKVQNVRGKGEKQVRSGNNLNILHQNIRSLWGKCGELEILRETEETKVEVLCVTEHWLNYHKLQAITSII
jgi:hypothetical protein